MLALGEHGHSLLLLLLHLRLRHRDTLRQGPVVAEWVFQLPVALAPELVVQGHADLCSSVNSLLPELVNILRVDVHRSCRVSQNTRCLCVGPRKDVTQHYYRLADSNSCMHDLTAGHGFSVKLLVAERFLVPFKCCGRLIKRVKASYCHEVVTSLIHLRSRVR